MHCPNCKALAPDEVATCPACGSSLKPRVERAEGRPAHLAVLEPVQPAPPPAVSEIPRPRLVSRAGPAIPVTKPTDDTAPTSWMARLQAAKQVGVTDPLTPAVRTPPPPPTIRASVPVAPAAPAQKLEVSKPPPLPVPPPRRPSPKPKAFSAKPAHLLLAELEAEDKKRKTLETTLPPRAVQTIADVEVPKPAEYVPKKRMPLWATLTLAGVVLTACLVVAVYFALREPPPKPAPVSAAILAEKKRAETIRNALDEGATFVSQGKDKADQAIAAYQRALTLDAKLPNAQRGLGIAFASKGDNERAVHHYRLYLELKPDASDGDQVRSIIEKYDRETKKRKHGR